MMGINKELFLQLVRLGIGTGNVLSLRFPDPIDWVAVKDLAEQQGLSAVVLDGIEKLPEQQRPPKVFLLEWIGETLQGYEYRYDLYCKAMAELADFYNSHGYKMMVLKGYACSLDWPKPEHRPCGDIDIWLFGKQKEADNVLTKEKGVEVDSSHHHHTVFYWGEFMVENHYDFINVHHQKSNKELDLMMKELAKDDSYYVDVLGEKVYLPSPNMHAFFLLRHALNHFAASEISIRQLLDWGFFVEKHTHEIDWDWLMKQFEQFKMLEMFNTFNAICVEDLGFASQIFQSVQFNPVLKSRVLYDIMNPAFGTEEPKQLFKRLVYKYRRWHGNAWKQELCYTDSRWSAFWSGVWSHILKPSSI